MPSEWILYTSLSPKALYRASLPDSPIKIKAGRIIFSDDVRINEDMEDTLKRAMTDFQEPSPFLVLGKDQKLQNLTLPERIIWWLTSVEDDQEDQLINRFFSVGIDESKEQDLASLTLTFAPLAEGRAEFPTTEEVLICREIIRQIKGSLWMVWAPYLTDAQKKLLVKWDNPSDRRNPGRFSDLIAAFTVLRCGQREIIEDGEYKKIISTIQDFEDAKQLYASRAENLSTKLTDRELHLVRWLKEKAGEKPYEFKINDLVKRYTGPDGKQFSPKSLERLLHGRKDRNSFGLLDRLRGGCLVFETKSETIYNEDRTRSRQARYNLYTFDTAKFDLISTYENVVSLETSSVNPKDLKGPPPDPSIGTDGEREIDIDNIDKTVGKDPLDPNITERSSEVENVPLSVRFGSNGSNGTDGEPGTVSPGSMVGPDGGTLGEQDGNSIKADLKRDEEQARAKEDHFKDVAEKYTKKPGKKTVPVWFLVDFSGYKRDDVVGIEAQGDLSARPGICNLISCGQCPTANNGSKVNPPVCDPCYYLGKGRAEA